MKLHHSALTLEGPAFIILPRRSPALAQDVLSSSACHRQRSLQVDYTETCIRQRAALRHLFCWTPAFTTGLRTPTLLTERAWQPSTGAQPSAGTPSLKSVCMKEVMKERTDVWKRIVAPTESKVNSVVYVENLRMYLDTSVQPGDLLHWVFSSSLNSVVLFRLLVQ